MSKASVYSLQGDFRVTRQRRRSVSVAQHDVPDAQVNEVRGRDGGVIRESLVMNAEWNDPHQRRISGYRRMSVLENLAARNLCVTRAHLTAADLYLRDYELGVEGARTGERLSVRISGTSRPEMSLVRLKALRRLRHANAALGPTLLNAFFSVGVCNMTISAFANVRGMNNQVAVGYLVAALDRLADFYATYK